MINEFGGVKEFYSKFYVSAVSPLGFIKNGVNMNYYDDSKLKNILSEFIIDSLKKQIELGIDTNVAFSLGKGENFKFLREINAQYKFFKQIIPLGHPRWIMQYRLKNKHDHIKDYIVMLENA